MTDLLNKVLTIKQEKVFSDRPRITILNINIDVLNVSETIDVVEKYIIQKEPLHLMGVNADKLNECNKNNKLQETILFYYSIEYQ